MQSKTFRQIFGDNMESLVQSKDGQDLIDLAKSYPKINYDDTIKNLVKELKDLFGDENILNIRK
jgi:hypothetical protein